MRLPCLQHEPALGRRIRLISVGSGVSQIRQRLQTGLFLPQATVLPRRSRLTLRTNGSIPGPFRFTRLASLQNESTPWKVESQRNTTTETRILFQRCLVKRITTHKRQVQSSLRGSLAMSRQTTSAIKTMTKRRTRSKMKSQSPKSLRARSSRRPLQKSLPKGRPQTNGLL